MVDVRWDIILYVATFLVLVITGLLVWFFIDKDNKDKDLGGGVSSTKFEGTLDTSNLYRFLEKQYLRDGNLGSFNACSTSDNTVKCKDDICSNCICPEKCRERGTKYMIMDKLGQDESEYRCLCFNRLRDVIDDTSNLTRDDPLITTKSSALGNGWKVMNQWVFQLLPPAGLTPADDVRLSYGSGGRYLEDNKLYASDARYKVYATYSDTPEEQIGAVYMLNSAYDDEAMANRLVDEF